MSKESAAAYNKKNLVVFLDHVHHNYLFGLFVLEKFPLELWDKASMGFMTPDKADMPRPGVLLPMNAVGDRMRDPAKRQRMQLEFERSLRRALLREPHDQLMWYCERRDQEGNLKTFQDWKHHSFASAIRQSIAHGESVGTLLWNNKWGKDPITWEDITLTPQMSHEPIPMDSVHALRWFRTLYDFIEKDIK